LSYKNNIDTNINVASDVNNILSAIDKLEDQKWKLECELLKLFDESEIKKEENNYL